MAEASAIAERGRASVQGCFAERGGSVGSIMELFSGKGSYQNESLKPSKVAIGFSPTRIHATETRRHKGASFPVSGGRSGATVRRAIASLPPTHQCWIHYCYNPSSTKHSESGPLYRNRLWAEFSKRHMRKGIHCRTKVTVRLMFQLQIDMGGTYYDFSRWSHARPAEFATIVSHDMWSKTYSSYWEAIRKLMVRIDEDAMCGVYFALLRIGGLNLG